MGFENVLKYNIHKSPKFYLIIISLALIMYGIASLHIKVRQHRIFVPNELLENERLKNIKGLKDLNQQDLNSYLDRLEAMKLQRNKNDKST